MKAISLILAISICINPCLYSQDLDDILGSSNVRGDNNNSQKTKNDPWLNYKENISLLFDGNQGVNNLHLWLDIPNRIYKPIRQDLRSTFQYAMMITEYQTPSNHKISLQAIVPHPRYLQMANSKLIKEFAELQEPALKILSTEELEIQNLTSLLYELPNNELGLLIKLSRGAFVYLKTSTSQKEELMELARLLSIKRLEQKLTS